MAKKTLLVLNTPNNNIYLSARNLERTNVTTAANLNTYQIMNAGNILMLESSVKEIENNLS
jgi:large subunit ribosomal protein L4